MRLILAILVAAGLGVAGWWYFVAETRDRALNDWLDQQRAAGWVAEATDISVSGFPMRHDTVITGLRLADPASGWSWTSEAFAIASPAHQPTEFNLDWPGTQVVASPYGTTEITAEVMTGTVAFLPNSRLTLDRTAVEIKGMRLRGGDGTEVGIDSAALTTSRATEAGIGPHAHNVLFEAADVQLPSGMAGDSGALPDELSRLRLDMTLRLDSDLDQPTIEAGGPRIEEVVLRDATATWGQLDLRGAGRLTVDAEGFAEGRIDLRARNWRDMVAVAEDGGYLPPGIAGALRGGLDLIATLTGDSESLKVPLDFADGRARIGPVTVGAAPRLAMPLSGN
jgi:hypothetical protein